MSDVSADRIAIRCAKKHTIAYPLSFEVRVQVEVGHRQLAWSMTMLPGQIVPIQLLDINQKVVLIASESEFLIDSSGLDRTMPIQFNEEASDEWYNEPQGAETELFGERVRHMLVSHTPFFVTFDGSQHDLDNVAAQLTAQSIVFERTDKGISVDLRAQEGDTTLQKGAFVHGLVDLYMENN